MKNNKFTKLLLSLLIALTISSVNTAIVYPTITASYDSQIQLLGEEPEETPFEKPAKP